MRTVLVVILPPGFDLSSCVTQTGKPVRIQAFIAQSTVEALYVGVLYRLAGLDELQPHPALFAPGCQHPTAKLRAVVRPESPQTRWHVRLDRRNLSRWTVPSALRLSHAAAPRRVLERRRAPSSSDPGRIHRGRNEAPVREKPDLCHGPQTVLEVPMRAGPDQPICHHQA
jgi:hypothetical protein